MKGLLQNACLAAALLYYARGCRLTLCRGKKPIAKNWQEKQYSEQEIEAAFDLDPDLNVGLVLGKESGTVDIECDSEQAELDLVELFDGDIPTTPCFRSERGPHYLMAWDDRFDEFGKAVLKWKEVEIRVGALGKAAQSLLPPSTTNESTREWIIPLQDCKPAMFPEHVFEKLREAFSPETPTRQVSSEVDEVCQELQDLEVDNRPGTEFNKSGRWEDILEPKGWQIDFVRDEVTHWRRPGKDEGPSATTGYCKGPDGNELFFSFSTNAAPVEPDKAYSKFALYALLYHDNDFNTAAAALRKLGYGAIESEEKKGQGRQSKATKLVQLAEKNAIFFSSPEGVSHASIIVDDHCENWPLSSDTFRGWLERQYYEEYQSVAGSGNVKDAVSLLSARARFDSPTLPVYVRVAESNGDVYIDVGDDAWRVIKITKDGWSVESEAPVKFIRPAGVLELPTPVRGGKVEMLREFVNIDDTEFPLLVGLLLGAFNPYGPYAVGILVGEQGAAKSTFARVVRSTVDPNVSPLRAAPKDNQDLMITAYNAWLLVFDNLSKISNSMSDALCRLATGGGFSCRALYTDKGESLFEGKRPTLLNGIECPTDRPDLLDRALVINLPVIPSNKRCPERELWEKFEAARPLILGALLDGVSAAVRNFPDTHLEEFPRMADFARWVTAAEPGLGWVPGTFMSAYESNRLDANEEVLEHPVAVAIGLLLDQQSEWTGTAADLLKELNSLVGEGKYVGGWPKDASKLSGTLRRLAPSLREGGIELTTERTAKKRKLSLRKGETVAAGPGE